jgi:murein DD-endopeptidase MepM/ murein hydrolase activator NlpD
VLWQWGPPLVIAAIAVTLVFALRSTLKVGATWSWRHGIAFVTLGVLVLTMGLYWTFPSKHDFSPSPVVFDLPLDGPITVAWGGQTARTNYHVSAPAERWAYDLLVTDNGKSFRGEGRAVEDYYAYDRPVQAPAGGRVVHVHDGEPDARPGRAEPSRGGGNYVVIEIAPEQYLFLVHLRTGTIRVRPGATVRRGDIVGRVGNSGNSSEPHLHLHVQDMPGAGEGQGIPFYFGNYVALPSVQPVTQGMPEGGTRNGQYIGERIVAGEFASEPFEP